MRSSSRWRSRRPLRRTDRAAAINVAALTQFSWVAFFAGPPLIGFAAEHFGSRLTFGIALPLVVLSLLLAPAVLGDRARWTRKARPGAGTADIGDPKCRAYPRSSRRKILPTGVFGSSVRNSMCFGRL